MFGSLRHLPPVSVESTLAREEGVLDLWYCYYECVEDVSLLVKWEALMSPDERQRYGAFRFERDRRLFLATRALVRTVLSHYYPVAPGEWRFISGKHGKPRISSPNVRTPIYFNLANTRGLAVCLVSIAHGSIGVDAELIDPKVECGTLADRYCSPSEIQGIKALPSNEQQSWFFAHWTLKESYVKALGIGLAVPVDQCSFAIGKDKITFESPMRGEACWRFALVETEYNHLIAVSADTGGAGLSLRASAIVPLCGNKLAAR